MNTSANHFLEFSGEKKTITQWERCLGFHKRVVTGRLERGWSIEDALTKPVNSRRLTKSPAELSKLRQLHPTMGSENSETTRAPLEDEV